MGKRIVNISSHQPLHRIQQALQEAQTALSAFVSGAVDAQHKSGGRGPVTEADRLVDRILRESLVRNGDGWLSEESADDLQRLEKKHVWVVDPLDGTREFVEGIPEWSVSIALVENGRAVAGGICNPATGETFLASLETGLTCNGVPARVSTRTKLEGATVLASRSEVRRGDWKQFERQAFTVRPMGSVAYKLARVAAGLEDATWTLCPKNEWDVAAGVALIEAAGGIVRTLDNEPRMFNCKTTLMSGLVASGPALRDEITALLAGHLPAPEVRTVVA
jgi:myo-inositol-1(or 4)-monophosphatase